MMMRAVFALLGLALTTVVAQAAEIKVLSAGAVEPGIEAFAHQLKRDTGHDLKILFNTAPQIAKRLAAGEVYDILISPPAVVDQAIKDGKIVAEGRVRVGRVGGGVHVRNDAQSPNFSTAEALKQAVLAADSVVYNTASTGLYLDKLFASMGILEQIKPKSTRYANGASVLEHVIKGKGNEIGFGAITEIKLFESKGLKYVGPLPAEVQNYTSYDAAMMAGATAADAAKEVLKIMAAPASKAIFVKAGVE
jgi:molybdate transport system substrate-binding protein